MICTHSEVNTDQLTSDLLQNICEHCSQGEHSSLPMKVVATTCIREHYSQKFFSPDMIGEHYSLLIWRSLSGLTIMDGQVHLSFRGAQFILGASISIFRDNSRVG